MDEELEEKDEEEEIKYDEDKGLTLQDV